MIIMKKIGFVVPCYNEVDNVGELYQQISTIMREMKRYEYEFIFIDNASTDGTKTVLRSLAKKDKKVKAIFNTRNFGQIRSPFYALLQCHADAVIRIAADLQDPPELIPEFIEKWESGLKVVMGVKVVSEESPIIYGLRSFYYKTLQSLAEITLVEHATGFGLYDQEVVKELRMINDPYPFFRGLIAEMGYKYEAIPYKQPKRKRGLTKNNFYTLYDMAMLGITNHSKLPLRIATMLGFLTSVISFLVGLVYLVYKLVNWQNFALGLAPVVVDLFFMGSIQLLFLGIVGEYIGAIYTQVLNRPLVVEDERLNF